MSWIRIEKRVVGLFPRYDLQVTADTCARVGEPGYGLMPRRTFKRALRAAICAAIDEPTRFPLEIELVVKKS